MSTKVKFKELQDKIMETTKDMTKLETEFWCDCLLEIYIAIGNLDKVPSKEFYEKVRQVHLKTYELEKYKGKICVADDGTFYTNRYLTRAMK